MQEYFLNQDIIGPYSLKLYGQRGDQVLIVSDHDNVMIVEKADVRFPVPMSALSREELKDIPAISVAKESTPPGRSQKKSRKAPPQESLF